MRYRRLGRSGLKVSEISFGAWVTFGNQIDEGAARELVHAAFDQGINYFDNADVYADGQAEIDMGKALRDLPRTGLVVSSKLFWPSMPGPNGRGLSRKHINESIDATLKRFGLDYLDLYFCHRFDRETPVEEVVEAMTRLVWEGKVLYWGTSEWRAWQIARAYDVAHQNGLIPPSMDQPQYNLFHRRKLEVDLVPLAEELGIGLTTFSPLYNGILSGKYNDGIPEGSRASLPDMNWLRARLTPERLDKVRQLSGIARELGATTAQLAIAWILRLPQVSSVITGATRLEQLNENVGASELSERLSDDVLRRIDAIFQNAPDAED